VTDIRPLQEMISHPPGDTWQELMAGVIGRPGEHGSERLGAAVVGCLQRGEYEIGPAAMYVAKLVRRLSEPPEAPEASQARLVIASRNSPRTARRSPIGRPPCDKTARHGYHRN
jgi:hypothetical protein